MKELPAIGLILLCGLAAEMTAAETNVIKEESVVIFRRSISNSVISYSVPESRFVASTNSWQPDQGNIPMLVHEFVGKAKAHAAQKDDPETLELVSMHGEIASRNNIVREGFSMRIAGRTECWAIVFEFARPGGISPVTVVMLYDGTIAEERTIEGVTSR